MGINFTICGENPYLTLGVIKTLEINIKIKLTEDSKYYG